MGAFQRMLKDTLFSSRAYLTRLRDPNRAEGDPLQDLLAAPGEVSGIVLAQGILQRYAELDEAGKRRFLDRLAEGFGLDAARVAEASQRYLEDASAENYKAFMEASEPPRQEVLRRLNTAPGGTLALVRMREDLLRYLKDEPNRVSFATLDFDFSHLFASWFNRGFLSVERIDWNSPAELLERIIRYEAVHSISGWDDLRGRVSAPDRACYAFFHPVLEDEPLIFVEVALTKRVPESVQALLEHEREVLDPEEAKTAVFYSISTCQRGLKGMSFGAFLIKQVLQELGQTYPKLNTWVTLSPVPKFTEWLTETNTTTDDVAELDVDEVLALPLNERSIYLKTYDRDLKRMALRYFTEAKGRRNAPLDPVARFHLNNGAKLLNVHPRADLSDKGIKEAFGLMVNYQYEPKKMLEHHEAYATKEVVVDRGLEKRLRG